MIKSLFLILSLLLVSLINLPAQDIHVISFEQDSLSVTRGKTEKIIELKINVQSVNRLSSSSLEIVVDNQKSDLVNSAYSFNQTRFDSTDIKQAEGSTLLSYLRINPDSLTDRKRVIVLKLLSKDSLSIHTTELNKGIFNQLVIEVLPYSPPKDSLDDFSHLAYIGTNFDLAEGQIESKNLFFASNILKKPNSPENKVGFYLSIYGNRAMTITDSSRSVQRTFFNPQTDSTYFRVNVQNEIITERTSDNIGSYISPLFELSWFKSSKKSSNEFALYYSPSLEFVWRRTIETQSFGDPIRDTTLISGSIPTNIASFRPLETMSRGYNEYMFNMGLVGLFMVFENKSISVRVHGSVGYSSFYRGNSGLSDLYLNEKDVFFTGRAWITEATTGITLQAEVNNTLNKPRPFFVATLSKAINFKDLGGFFKPITSR